MCEMQLSMHFPLNPGNDSLVLPLLSIHFSTWLPHSEFIVKCFKFRWTLTSSDTLTDLLTYFTLFQTSSNVTPSFTMSCIASGSLNWFSKKSRSGIATVSNWVDITVAILRVLWDSSSPITRDLTGTLTNVWHKTRASSKALSVFFSLLSAVVVPDDICTVDEAIPPVWTEGLMKSMAAM